MDMKQMKEHGAIRHDTKYGYIEADYYEPVQVMYDPSVPLFYIYRASDTEKVEVSDMKRRFPEVAKRFLRPRPKRTPPRPSGRPSEEELARCFSARSEQSPADTSAPNPGRRRRSPSGRKTRAAAPHCAR